MSHEEGIAKYYEDHAQRVRDLRSDLQELHAELRVPTCTRRTRQRIQADIDKLVRQLEQAEYTGD